MATRLVIDTNVLVSSLASKSKYHWLIQDLLQEKFELFVTYDILLKYSSAVASNFLTVLRELPNVHFVQVYFYWNILKDTDDNKFVDCYVASSSHYLLTHDQGFNN